MPSAVVDGPAAVPGNSRCDAHGGRGAWSCQACSRVLCPRCAYEQQTRSGRVTLCVHCGGLALPLTRPRRILPWWALFPDFLGALFSVEGLAQIIAIGLVCWLVGLVPAVGAGIASFIFITYFFRVITAAARGETKLPDPEDFLGFESIFPPMLRFNVATMCLWLPALVYLYATGGFTRLVVDGPKALVDPVLFAIGFAGLLYFPAALIAAAVADSFLAVINPWITVRLILRIPQQYFLTWAACFGLVLLDVFLSVGLLAIERVFTIPIVTGVIVESVSLVLPLLTAMILGRLIYQNAEQFGLLLVGEDEELLWPEAQPEATPPTDTRSARARPAPGPVDVPDWMVQGVVPEYRAPEPAPEPEAPPLELDLDDSAAPAEALETGAPKPRTPITEPAPPVRDAGAREAVGQAADGRDFDFLAPVAEVPAPSAPPELTPPTEAPTEAPSEAPADARHESGDTTVPVPSGGDWNDDGDDTEIDLFSADLDWNSGGVEVSAPPPDVAKDLSLDLPARSTWSVELNPEAAPAPTPLAPSATVPVLMGSPLHHPPGAIEAPEDPDDEALRAALDANDVPGVLQGFRPRSEGRYPALGPRRELRLANILERAGHYDEAVKACQRAAQAEDAGSFATRALYMGGRILKERLGNVEEARRVWTYLAEAYPSDEVAHLAREGLRKLG